MDRQLALILASAFTLNFPGILQADEWPEFRGPTAQGHAPNAEVPLEWSHREAIRWKIPVDGKAWSSPVVSDGVIYVTTAAEKASDLSLEAHAYDLQSGEEIWVSEVFEREASHMHKKNSQASPTPIVADGRLYVHFGHFGTACLNTKDGVPLWKQEDITYSPVHGTGGSPLLLDGKLIYSCDGKEDPFVIALDAASGDVAWKTDRNVDVSRTFSFSTPLAIEVNGETQVVLPGSGAVISYNPVNGKEIWRCLYGEGYSVVPRPLFHDGIVYVCSGFNRAGLYAIRPDGEGDVTGTHIVWQDEKAIPKESSPIIVDDLLYVNDDKGILSCFDAKTGEEHYRERLNGEGGFSSSPVYANGHLFFHNGEGITTVVKPGTEFERVAENDIDEFGLSSFAVVSDGFIVRTEENLLRIGE